MKTLYCRRFIIHSLFALTLLACGVESSGQGIKLTVLGGYTIQDRVHGYNGDVVIKDGAHFGGMLSYQKSDQLAIDFTYLRQGTSFKISNFNAPANSGSIPGSVSYYMLGTSHSTDFSAKVSPYGGIMLGMAVLAPSEKFNSETRFAVGAKLGAIIHANERIGIVLQTQLMIPVQGVGIGVGCGSGGCGTGAGTSSTCTQLGFTGGVEIKLNN